MPATFARIISVGKVAAVPGPFSRHHWLMRKGPSHAKETSFPASSHPQIPTGVPFCILMASITRTGACGPILTASDHVPPVSPLLASHHCSPPHVQIPKAYATLGRPCVSTLTSFGLHIRDSSGMESCKRSPYRSPPGPSLSDRQDCDGFELASPARRYHGRTSVTFRLHRVAISFVAS